MGPADRAPRDPAGPQAPDETFLLARAQRGDLPAFEEVVRRYQRRVYGTALRIVRCHDLADDVSQEAFVRAWRSLDRFDTARPFGPWVCRIAANLALNHLRSPRAREEALPEEPAEPRSEAPGPLEALLDDEGRRLLEAALAELPAEQRAVFVLRAFEELSYAEIAEALDLQPGTVMSRLFRARERLARALRPYLGLHASRPRGGAA